MATTNALPGDNPTYIIVCPGCKQPNTLIYRIQEVRDYKLLAKPSPSKAGKGVSYLDAGRKDETKKVACTYHGCTYESETVPNSAAIVVQVTGHA